MKTKLLLLEDDLTLSETIVDYFEEQGFEVVAAYDGEEALSAADGLEKYTSVFSNIGFVLIGIAILIAILNKPLKKLMHGVE